MKYVIVLAVLFLIQYFIIGKFVQQLKDCLVRQKIRRLMVGVLILALLISQVDVINTFFAKQAAGTVTAAETVETGAISAFIELPGEIREQVVPVGTTLEELALPDTLEAVWGVAGPKGPEDTAGGIIPDEEIIPEEIPESPKNGSETGEEPSDGAGSVSGSDVNTMSAEDIAVQFETVSFVMPEYQAENILEVETLEADSSLEDTDEQSEETFGIQSEENLEISEEIVIIENVTWQSEPEYDGDVEGEYIFTAVLPEGYVLTDGVDTPQIKVTVGDNKEQTAKLLMTGWHFGEGDVYPQGNLFYDEERYSFVLAGGSSETQIPFEEITDFLPTAVTAEFLYQSLEKEDIEAEDVEDASEEVLPIIGWSCPEYVQDEEGCLPYRGEFFFTALLDEDDTYELSEDTTQPGVWVIFDEPMLLASVTATPGTISSNQEWGAQTLSAGTYIINPGVTVTVTGCLTVSGNVTIKGGGKIVRGSSSAYFSVTSSGDLTLADIEVDGKSISSPSSNVMITVSSGSVTLDDGCWIHDCINNSTRGSALYIDGGTGVFNDVTIENCSASGNGGAIYVYNESEVTINGGVYQNNSVRNTTTYGGGFAYNNEGCLYIYGGKFLNNTSAGKAGCIYTSSNAGTKTYLYGGYFSGNKCTYTNYEGSGALYYSAMYDYGSILQLSGSVQLVGDGTSSGVDGLYLDISSSTSQKARISSQLQYPLPIYLKASEGYVIAEGVDTYELKESDMKKISFYDISNSGKTWYAVLDNKQIKLSATDPGYGLYVTYNGNGASSGTVTDEKEYTNGDTVTLKSNGFAYAGHTFVGWNTKADGTGTSYKAGDKVQITEDMTLYAIWTYNVTYNYAANGGSSSTKASAAVATGAAIDLTSPVAVKAGWDFVGWNTNQNAQVGLTSLTMGKSNITLYAIYKKTLTASFYSGSSNSTQTKSVIIYNNNTSGTVTAPALSTWSGWTASGWSTIASTYSSSLAANTSATLTGDTTYYGIYQKEITLSYNANGGSAAPKSQSGYRYANVHATTTYQDPSFTLAAAITRTGHTFDGWHLGSASGAVQGAGTSVTLSENATYYAGWEVDTYTVTYHKNGGTIANEGNYTKYTYGEGLTLPEPTREDFTFDGWHTSSDFSGKKVTSISAGETGNKDYYAKWTYASLPEASLPAGDDKIGGLIPGAEYDITYTDENGNEHTDTRRADENGNLEIEDGWTGKSVDIKKKGSDTGTDDIPSVSLDIPEREPEVPEENITASDESVKGEGDGAIGGLVPGGTYQVSTDGGNTWEDRVADENGEIKPLEPGGYDVRKKAEDGKLPSKSVHVDIEGSSVTPEEEPEASLPAGDDKIGGLVPGAEYDITYTDENGKEHTDTRKADENGNLEIEDSWTGKSVGIKKKGNGTDTADSPSVSFDIPGRVDEMPEENITASGETAQGAGNGKIGGLTPGGTYQISTDGGETWEERTADENGEIKPLEPGSYDVRKKAEDGKLPSKSVHVTVEAQSGGNTGNDDSSAGSGSADGNNGNSTEGGGSGTGNGNNDNSAADGGSDAGNVTTGSTQNGIDAPGGKQSGSKAGTDRTDTASSENTGSTGNGTEAATGAGQNAGRPGANGTAGRPSGRTERTVRAELKNGEIVINGDISGSAGASGANGISADGSGAGTGESGTSTVAAGTAIATGTIGATEATTTTFTVGEGAVSITVVSDEYQHTAGVADTVAVANAVLTTQQKQLVNNGETIEIRVEVKDIATEVLSQDKDVIESGLRADQNTESGQVSEELTLGSYIDISMYIKVGDSDWNAVTQTGDPIEVVIGIPKELQSDGRIFYIARCHEGEYALLEDMDSEPDTITIQTGQFSTYAIVYRVTAAANAEGHSSFLGICYFVWLLMIIALIGIVITLIYWRQGKKDMRRLPA